MPLPPASGDLNSHLEHTAWRSLYVNHSLDINVPVKYTSIVALSDCNLSNAFATGCSYLSIYLFIHFKSISVYVMLLEIKYKALYCLLQTGSEGKKFEEMQCMLLCLGMLTGTRVPGTRIYYPNPGS